MKTGIHWNPYSNLFTQQRKCVRSLAICDVMSFSHASNRDLWLHVISQSGLICEQ